MAILTGHDLTERLRYEMGFTKEEAEDSLQFLLNEITEALKNGDDVWLQHFIRMRLVDRPARPYMNMVTGEMSTLAPGKRIRVRFSPALLEQLDPGYGLRIGDDGEVYSVRASTDIDSADIDSTDELEEFEPEDEDFDSAVEPEEIEDELGTEPEEEPEDSLADTRAALADFVVAKRAGLV